MKILIKAGRSNNYISTIAIGEKYQKNFYRYAYPSWKDYCNRYQIGLIIFEQDLIDESSPFWKKATWQKLLIGKKVKSISDANNICYLDTDIIISPLALNIFEYHDSQCISVISQINNLPFPDYEVRKRVAYFRNKYIDPRYPLDSALFATPKQIFEYHSKEPQEDYFCAGVFVFNVKNYASLMEKWFNKYPRDVNTLTGGGDEPIVNYEFQSNKKIKYLDYKFQALWLYEMAWKYPFLYRDVKNLPLARVCIEAALLNNHFLHFCGSWAESDMFMIDNIYSDKSLREDAICLIDYVKKPYTGNPVGMVKPVNK